MDFVADGYDWVLPDTLTREDRAWIDGVNRPASAMAAKAHLMRLAVHKRIDGGTNRQTVVIGDIARECAGLSEYAVVQTCLQFLRSESPFFPNIGEFLQAAKELSDSYAALKAKADGTEKPRPVMVNDWREERRRQRESDPDRYTPEKIAKVSEMVAENFRIIAENEAKYERMKGGEK